MKSNSIQINGDTHLTAKLGEIVDRGTQDHLREVVQQENGAASGEGISAVDHFISRYPLQALGALFGLGILVGASLFTVRHASVS